MTSVFSSKYVDIFKFIVTNISIFCCLYLSNIIFLTKHCSLYFTKLIQSDSAWVPERNINLSLYYKENKLWYNCRLFVHFKGTKTELARFKWIPFKPLLKIFSNGNFLHDLLCSRYPLFTSESYRVTTN